MLTFIIRRFLSLVPLFLAVTLLVSVLLYISPGDVLDEMRGAQDIPKEYVEEMEQRFNLVDDEGEPTRWYARYAAWLGSAVQLDFGRSFKYQIPVTDLIGQRIVNTLFLSLTSILFAWAIAIPLGVLAAIYKDSIWDRLSAFLAYAALSIPEFFLAILAVYFAAVTGLFPTGGATSVQADFAPWYLRALDFGYHLILPTIVLGIGAVAGMMRVMRANFIDYMRAEFVTTARAKGLSERVVMFKHVLRNAVNPLITSFGFAFSTLLSGALLVENVMNYPGLGQLIFQSIMAKDVYVVMAAVLVSVFMLVMGNLLADILLAWSDPRIRLEGGTDRTASITRSRMLFWTGILLFIVGYEILIEWAAPGILPYILVSLKWGAIYIGGLVALACIFAVGSALYLLTRSYFKPIMKRPMGAFALTTLGILYFLAFFAHFIAPYEANRQNLDRAYHPPTAIVWADGGLAVQAYELANPDTREYRPIEGKTYPLRFFAKAPAEYDFLWLIKTNIKLFQIESDDPHARVYLLGSDKTGRDIFSRLLYGAQVSLSVGLVGIAITMTLGFIVGGLSGYYGGGVDFVLMRIVELMMSLPGLYLLLTLRATFPQDLSPTQIYVGIIVILSLIGWAGAARVIRGMSLSVRNRQFVLAAESMGQPTPMILLKHLLPNLASYLLVAATLSIPGYILGEAALSFLGLGISEPAVSWGLMLKQSQSDMKVFFLGFWWLLLPGAAIFLTVIAFNLLGDVLRDVVDPRMKM